MTEYLTNLMLFYNNYYYRAERIEQRQHDDVDVDTHVQIVAAPIAFGGFNTESAANGGDWSRSGRHFAACGAAARTLTV